MMMHVPTTYQRVQGMGYAFRGMGDDGSGETDTEGSGTPGGTDNSSGELGPTGAGYSDPCIDQDTGEWTGSASCVAQGAASQQQICASAGGVWANNTCTSISPTAGGLVAGQQAYNNPTTCAAAGGVWNGATCGGVGAGTTPGLPPTGSALTNFLNSLESNTPTILRAITGQTVTAAQCAAAGGTLSANGTCSPGVGSYLPLLLIAGMGILVISVMSGKGR